MRDKHGRIHHYPVYNQPGPPVNNQPGPPPPAAQVTTWTSVRGEDGQIRQYPVYTQPPPTMTAVRCKDGQVRHFPVYGDAGGAGMQQGMQPGMHPGMQQGGGKLKFLMVYSIIIMFKVVYKTS
jgi:hypothetical protein